MGKGIPHNGGTEWQWQELNIQADREKKNAILMERLTNIENRLSELESKKVKKPATEKVTEIQEATNE